MPIKKAANKVKGLSRFTKLNILVFSLLFAGVGSYLVINSRAGTGGQFFISTTVDGVLTSGFQIQFRSVGATAGCNSNIASYGIVNGDWHGVTNATPATDYGLQIYNCFTGSNNTKLYRITDAKAATPRAVNFVGIQYRNSLTGQWLPLQGPEYAFNVYESPHVGQQGLRILYTSISPPPTPPPPTPPPPTPPPPTPSPAVINSFSANPGSVNSGGTSTLSWSASNVSTCAVTNSSGAWFRTLSSSGGSSSGSIATPALTASDTFTIGCMSSNGGAGATRNASVSVNGQPPPPPPTPSVPCPAGYRGIQPNCEKVATSTDTRVVTRTVTVPTNSSDKERPTVPENLVAEQAGNGEVTLSWDASTDNIGVVGYTVERSSDGTNWEMLDEAVVDTTYADNTAEFGTQYSYRVSAQDAAGNFSDYAVTDLLTNEFTPNVYPDQDSSITSEDGIVTVNIPAGALSEEAYCEILKDTVSAKAPKGYKLAAGAYTIDCKNKDGDGITEFEKAATVVMDMKDFKQYKKFAVFSIDGSNLTNLNATYDSNDKTLTFKMTEFATFAAYGAKGGSLWWLWLLILLLIGGLIFFIIRLRNSGNSDDSYYDTTSYVTMPPTQTVGPGGPEQHTSLPDMVAQGQQPIYPQDPYAQPPQYPGQQPPAGPGQQPPQYPS